MARLLPIALATLRTTAVCFLIGMLLHHELPDSGHMDLVTSDAPVVGASMFEMEVKP